MPRVSIAFTRTGTFTLSGKASVDVTNKNYNWEDVLGEAENKQFTEFLPMGIEYSNSVWEFEPIEENKENTDETA